MFTAVADALKAIVKQPFWVVVFISGVILACLPCVVLDKQHWFSIQTPSFWPMVALGVFLVVVALGFYGFAQLERIISAKTGSIGLDTRGVSESGGAFSVKLDECQIRVIYGRLENYHTNEEAVLVLPCNEFFDRDCITDPKGALGGYLSAKFSGRVDEFAAEVQTMARQHLGPGQMQQKSHTKTEISFGPGRALLMPLQGGPGVHIALISTTSLGPDGLISRTPYVFDGLTELVKELSDTPRAKELIMPVLGSGHGGISGPLALVRLLLTLAEVIKYGQGVKGLKRITVVIFKRDSEHVPDVDPLVIRRSLALIY